MEYILLLLFAGLVIWYFNKKSSNNKDIPDQTNIDNSKNDVPPLPTIASKSDPPLSATVTRPISDMPLTVASSSLQPEIKQPKPPDTKSSKNATWITPGGSIVVSGYLIEGGMIYVGTGMKSAQGYGTECALIDPYLKLDKNNDDYRVRRMPYWPSYSEVSPDARASYLKWLSTGKNDPEADIGYVFLYFYGIERRLLYDSTQGLVSEAEIQTLLNELNRLLSIYSSNGSFKSYASSLLSYTEADHNSKVTQYNGMIPVYTRHFGLPINLQICLGQMVKDDIPIPAEWAMAWYLSTPNPPVYVRTPAIRCQQEFQTLFAEEYNRRFNAGLKSKDNHSRIKIEHRPASKSLINKSYAKTLDLPDVTSQTRIIYEIAPLIQICQDKLDSYSRYLGRNPEGKDTLDALLELPVSVWPNPVKEYLYSLQTELSQQNTLSMNFSTLLNHFPDWQDKSKKRLTHFFECLAACNIGMEPDLRYSGIKPEPDMPIMLFYQDEDSANIGPAYGAAALTMHLAAMVSQSDGEVCQEEIDVLENRIERSLELKSPEIKRLKVHLQWLLSQPLSIKGMKKRIESLEVSDRETIGDLLIQVSWADGKVLPSEIKFMEKIFAILEIDLDVLYSKIHSSYAEPVTVKAAAAVDAGFAIPTAPSIKSQSEGKFTLDMSKVAALHTDTQHITSLLSSIFNPDEEEQKADNIEKDTVAAQESNRFWGLAAPIFEFVQILISKSTWERYELEELAYNKKMMLEGLLEQINEAAFEHFDEPFIEGEDPFEINQEIVAVMN